MSTFTSLGVPKDLVRVLAGQGIDTPFPIQEKTLPDTLAGRDVLGRGRTGSGKTIAFGLPLIARLAEHEAAHRRKPGRPLGLVLAPTRELANQIDKTFQPLAAELGLKTAVIYGGVSQRSQERALAAGVDVVIACPGRLEDLLRQKLITLESVEITVLDEADHMADLGFLPVVKRLLDATKSGGQRLLFSATLDNGVDQLVKRYLQNPVKHSVDNPDAAVSTMEHHVLVVPDQSVKTDLVKQLASGSGRRVMFMRTKHHAKKMAKSLTAAGIPAVDLHGNLSQNARDRNLAEFSSGQVRVLVATDVAARGVHVDDVELVVHIDPPTEHKAYLHRSGRTARAGSDGTVVTVVLPEQKYDVGKLMRAAGVNVAFESVAATSPLVGTIVGEQAAKVDPAIREREAAQRTNERGGRPGSGTSTGANAQRKRARRGAPHRSGSQDSSRGGSQNSDRSGARDGARSGGRNAGQSGARSGSQHGNRDGARSGGRNSGHSGSRDGARAASQTGGRSGGHNGAQSGGRNGSRDGNAAGSQRRNAPRGSTRTR